MEKFKLEISEVFHDQTTCVKKCKRHTCRPIATSENFSTLEFRRREDKTCRQNEYASSVSSSGRCYTENRNRLRKFCVYFLIFLLPLAVEVAASAASAELHKTRHESSRRHARDSHHHDHHDKLRHRRFSVPDLNQNGSLWPAKRVAEIYGDIVIGGLHMIHEREDAIICGPVMPQGGLQASMKSRPKLKYSILYIRVVVLNRGATEHLDTAKYRISLVICQYSALLASKVP
jgi:hypothetical protein